MTPSAEKKINELIETIERLRLTNQSTTEENKRLTETVERLEAEVERMKLEKETRDQEIEMCERANDFLKSRLRDLESQKGGVNG